MWSRISFGDSGIKRQTTAKALKHPDHPLATLSISLLRLSHWLWGGPSEVSEYPKGLPFHVHIAGNGPE
jgi:hypothetical protein